LPDLLARLSNLQELHLVSKGEPVPSSCLAGIAQLQQLTQLQLSGECSEWEDIQQGLQQLFAQPLPLPLLRLQLDNVLRDTAFSDEGKKGLDLSGLTQLLELVTAQLSEAWVLPAQLTSLQLETVDEASMLQPLRRHQQLQRLALEVCFADSSVEEALELVQIAASMPALQHLDMRYVYAIDAVHSAPTWKQLPLRELSIFMDPYFPPDEQEMASVLQGLAAAVSVTKLVLDAWYAHETDDVDGDGQRLWTAAPVAACATLAQVTGLRDLCITQDSVLPPGDALALTALTNLTRLVMNGLDAGVGSAAAAALMQSLTQLQHLDLRDCEVDTAECEMRRKQLVQLTQLLL
jgi:hypothetical protein